MNQKSIKTLVTKQGKFAALGATAGAVEGITKHTLNVQKGPLIFKAAQAAVVAAVGGSGLGGSIAAGAAVITAPITALMASPVALGAVIVGATGFGLYKLCKWASETDTSNEQNTRKSE